MLQKLNSKKVTFLILGIYLILCISNALMPYKEFSENENRQLSPFPKASFADLSSGEFMEEYENYITDKFILRDAFVSLKSAFEKATGRLESGGVYFGKNGFLIEKPAVFDTEVLNKNIKALKTFNSLRRYKITTAIIPTAFEIEKDNLPKTAYQEVVKNELSYIKAGLDDTKIDFVDTTYILSSKKDDYLYYKTDHHQTANGSYYVYKALGESLGYTPYELNHFDISVVSDSFKGSTWSKTMLLNIKPDSIIKYSHKTKGELVTVSYPEEDITDDNTLYQSQYLNKKDKYSYYMGGNHPVTHIHTTVDNGKSIAVFKDSYANSIMPFLSLHFEDIHVIDLRYYNKDIIEYLSKNQLTDILILYNTSTFMTDTSLQKLEKYTLTSDYAKTAFGRVPKSSEVEMSYFDDAVFIGDSLTEGLRLFTPLEDYASFYCEVGSALAGVYSHKFVNVLGYEEQKTVFEALKATKPKKIYILLGINDGPEFELADDYEALYTAFINDLNKELPESTIYIQSVMPVSKIKEFNSKFKNGPIYEYNKRLEKIAVNNKAYFLPVFELFTDDSGYLKANITPDGVHLYQDYYKDWLSYLKTHTVPDVGAADKKDVSSNNLFDGFSKNDIDALAKKLIDNIQFEDTLKKASPNSIFATFAIDPKLLTNGVVYGGSGITAEEIAVFELKNKNSAKQITSLLEKHIKEKREAYKGYIPKELIKLKKPVIKSKDNIVVLCISPNDTLSEKLINEYLDSLTNGQ